ncbi:hypothetical protein [Kineococcus sp. SYSU DK005]|uniref:hypothetical protein n=1 Tax=Kineococcus sp. SYSU DK005 TaxID=3383126 RepID=UPI003D7C6BF5
MLSQRVRWAHFWLLLVSVAALLLAPVLYVLPFMALGWDPDEQCQRQYEQRIGPTAQQDWGVQEDLFPPAQSCLSLPRHAGGDPYGATVQPAGTRAGLRVQVVRAWDVAPAVACALLGVGGLGHLWWTGRRAARTRGSGPQPTGAERP